MLTVQMASCSIRAKIISEISTRKTANDIQNIFWGISSESKLVCFVSEYNRLHNVETGNFIFVSGLKITPRDDMMLAYILDHTEVINCYLSFSIVYHTLHVNVMSNEQKLKVFESTYNSRLWFMVNNCLTVRSAEVAEMARLKICKKNI